jgi:hypothetical protein
MRGKTVGVSLWCRLYSRPKPRVPNRILWRLRACSIRRCTALRRPTVHLRARRSTLGPSLSCDYSTEADSNDGDEISSEFLTAIARKIHSLWTLRRTKSKRTAFSLQTRSGRNQYRHPRRYRHPFSDDISLLTSAWRRGMPRPGLPTSPPPILSLRPLRHFLGGIYRALFRLRRACLRHHPGNHHMLKLVQESLHLKSL